jgi:subfamily B ATP-binding cassette protein MsbA
MRDFLRVLGLSKRHRAWMLVAAVSMVIAGIATIFAFNLVRPIFDQILRPVPLEESVLEIPETGMVACLDRTVARAENLLRSWIGRHRTAILALALVAIVCKNFFAFLARFASARFGLATIRDLRIEFFGSLLGQSPGYFFDRSTATLVSRATNDLQLLREALAERLGDVAQDLVTVPLILIYLLSLDLRLTLATAVALPVLFAPVLFLSRRLRDRARQSQEGTGEVATVIDETVRSIRVVQNFGMAGFMADRFRHVNQKQYAANLAARAIQAANAPAMEVVGVFAAVAVISYAALKITAGAMTLGGFSAFVLGAYAIYNPLKRLNKFNLVIQQAAVASSRVFEVIDAPVVVRERPGARPLAEIGSGIRFEGVGFSYRPDTWVLRGFDLHIPYGSTVALVGPSGSGKSTVAQLIPRFFDVREGVVRIGDLDVRDLELASLRSQIGFVTQETLLFNDTVRTNILCGRCGVSSESIEAAVRAAGADTFIRGLPDGYETVIGEGGVTLSGGQRQRLAIARALVTDPPMVILDEATSALDPESETQIQQSLKRFAGRRTTLVIAHRLATVRRADVIAVVAEGRVAELGTHDELIAAAGLYRRMVEMQELT